MMTKLFLTLFLLYFINDVIVINDKQPNNHKMCFHFYCGFVVKSFVLLNVHALY